MMKDLHFSAKPASIPLIVEKKKMVPKEARHPHSTVTFTEDLHRQIMMHLSEL